MPGINAQPISAALTTIDDGPRQNIGAFQDQDSTLNGFYICP